MEHEYCLVLWKESVRYWFFEFEWDQAIRCVMQLPKAIKVSSIEDAKLVVDVYNRALLFVVGEGEEARFVRVSPSGKEEDLTEKVRKAYALVSGSVPLKQGGIFDEASEAKSRRK